MNASVGIVTGAAGAIGQALCAALREHGYRVIALDLPRTTIPPQCEGVFADLAAFATDADYRQTVIAELKIQIGSDAVHVLINNAAIQIVKPATDLLASDLHESLSVNTIAPFLLAQGLLAELREARGSVVNIASIHASQTKREFLAYAMSKAALVGLTRSMALEFSPEVRVNAISPAAVDTSMLRAGLPDARDYERLAEYHPLRRIADPSDVANVAVFLTSHQARFITGANIHVDGGISGVLSDPTLETA